MLRKTFTRLAKTSSVALTGLGGIGKTQIALMYAEKYKKKYACRWWIDASSEQSILEAYRDFAIRNLGIPDALAPETYLEPVKRWMRGHEKWLFIFDNADYLADKQKWVPVDLTGRRHVLFTSRASNWYGVADVLEVDLLTSDEARAYFIKATGREDDGALDDLIVALGYLPLGLAQAAAYIRVNVNGYKEYLALFTSHTMDMLQMYPTANADKLSAYATWDISINRIERKSTRQLLSIMAFFAPDGMRAEWFEKGREALPEPLQAGVSDVLEWNAILEDLIGNSLLRLNNERMSVHRLVGEVVRNKLMAASEYEMYAEYAAGVGEKLCFFDFPTRESRDALEDLYPHIEAIVRNCASKNPDAQAAVLYSFLGKGAQEVWGEYDRALEWYEKARGIRERILGIEHPNTAATYNNIASVYASKGEYDRALEWYKKALTIFEKAMGKEHPTTAATYNNIASVYANKGEYERALEWGEKALIINEKVLGVEHPDTAATYNNIAFVHASIGDYSYALEWYEKALAICEKIFGTEHPDTAVTYSNIASVYTNKGDYDRALGWYEKALAIREKILGSEHPNTEEIYKCIADVYSKKGEYDRAREWTGKAQPISESILGKKNTDTLEASKENKPATIKGDQKEQGSTLDESTIGALVARLFEERDSRSANDINSRTSQLLNESEKRISNFIEQIQSESGLIGMTRSERYFKGYAEKCRVERKKWIFAIMGLISVLLGIVLIFYFFPVTADNNFELYGTLGLRITTLAVFISAVAWCGKIYKALYHQEVVNSHKALCLQTVGMFVNSTSSKEDRDAIILQVTKAVFSNMPTGFIADNSNDSDFNIIYNAAQQLGKQVGQS